MKLSPFQELLRAVENEHFIKCIEYQADPKKFNQQWFVGYMQALKLIIDKAYNIYNRRN